MRIKLICVGKLREKYLREAVNEYSKRLSSYGKLEILEIKDERDGNPDGLRKEAEGILGRIKDSDYIFALAIEGSETDSEGFSKMIDELGIRGISDIAFVIGGSNGLHKIVLNRADKQLSFSKMTFPHQLMRVILLEQIYRAYKISNGEKYHK